MPLPPLPALSTRWKTSPAPAPALTLALVGDLTGKRGPVPPTWVATLGHLLLRLEAVHHNKVMVEGSDKVSTAEDDGDVVAPARSCDEEVVSTMGSVLRGGNTSRGWSSSYGSWCHLNSSDGLRNVGFKTEDFLLGLFTQYSPQMHRNVKTLLKAFRKIAPPKDLTFTLEKLFYKSIYIFK
uniref:Uncharacterized protein n=1 Tax=Oryza nivara TaxID=4536 RepID=A0A0E0I9W3_ORYNI